MSLNPYQPPGASDDDVEDAPATVHVGRFRVTSSSFKCRSFTRESLAQTLEREILANCEKRGLEATTESQADVQISGAVRAVNEGSQLLRYLVPFLGGSTLVHVRGSVKLRGEEPRPFDYALRSHMGILGGRGQTLIRLALQRIGLLVASDAASRAAPASQEDRAKVYQYFLCVGLVALFLSAAFAIFGSRWAHSMPRTNNSIRPDKIFKWAAINAVALFITAGLTGTALAPARILQSPQMYWLMERSGVNSLIASRLVLLLIAVFVGAFFVTFSLSAMGS